MAQKGKGNTVDKIVELITPFAEGLGLSIWDIRFLKEGINWYLRIFIDREGGVSVDDCADLSRAMNKPLDQADIIEQTYVLEVSSPGIERELRTDAHFENSIGKPVMLRTIRPVEGVRDFSGILQSFDGSEIAVSLSDDKMLNVKIKETSFVKLDDFNMADFK